MLALDADNKASYSGSGDKWNDLSGNLNNVTWTDQPTFNANGYFTFNGTSNYGTIPDSPSLGVTGFDITMEVWVRFTSFGGDNGIQFPIMKAPYTGGSNNNGGNYGMWVEGADILLSSNDGTGDKLKGVLAENLNTSSTWYQIVFIQSANGYRVVRNGSILNAVYGDGIPAPLKPTTNNLLVGKRADGFYLYGDLAVVNVWDRALSDVEILQNYNYYHPRFA
jgi:hypothetical protein